MLSIENLTVALEKELILDHFNIEINKGEIYAFIGPSGCGKSTLVKVLAGIIKKQEGEITLHGQKLDSKQHNIGFIPQNYGLLPWHKVRRNIEIGLSIKGKAKNQKIIQEIVEELELTPLLNKYPSGLSGGQKQRCAIARAFAMEPELLLMDEPFSALDALTSEKAQALFLKTYNKHQVTTLLITHNVEEAVFLGKKIIILSDKPCKVLKVIDNTCFGKAQVKETKEYYEMVKEIRQIINEAWNR